MSTVNLLIHIVISTHNREMSIPTDHSDELYRYISGIMKNYNCKVIAINGIPNHIHALIDMSQTIAVADLMREVKRSSSVWMKKSGHFPMFLNWSEGYFAASVSFTQKQNVIDYISQQRMHHRNKRFEEEYDRLILKNGLVEMLGGSMV